jgi:hypothetical protein
VQHFLFSEENEDEDDDQKTLIKQDDIGYRLSQHADSPKKPSESLEFDDEDSWGDFGQTPHNKARDGIVERRQLVTSKLPFVQEKGKDQHCFKHLDLVYVSKHELLNEYFIKILNKDSGET